MLRLLASLLRMLLQVLRERLLLLCVLQQHTDLLRHVLRAGSARFWKFVDKLPSNKPKAQGLRPLGFFIGWCSAMIA